MRTWVRELVIAMHGACDLYEGSPTLSATVVGVIDGGAVDVLDKQRS